MQQAYMYGADPSVADAGLICTPNLTPNLHNFIWQHFYSNSGCYKSVCNPDLYLIGFSLTAQQQLRTRLLIYLDSTRQLYDWVISVDWYVLTHVGRIWQRVAIKTSWTNHCNRQLALLKHLGLLTRVIWCGYTVYLACLHFTPIRILWRGGRCHHNVSFTPILLPTCEKPVNLEEEFYIC